ncbi:hypothetical protein [Microbacterium sp. AK031]|uniref:hypothetical protein n=1 Tax=Microbacterium sp. AK031 TaxID=2723076 RepID=UPI00216A5039|nr:hypothetical protein [Microbacterium sp. AK031]MCS3841781.1 energy-coupling factor transporter ATP-binding protein EcfA2 [Microbacterium sp. AK031]
MTSSTFAVSALGARIELAFAEEVPEDVVARIRRSWSGAAIEPGSAFAVDSASAADQAPDVRIEVDAVGDVEHRLETLSTRVTLDALAHNRGRLVMLHAAGVALEDGRVIAFVGPSGRGKTTLSRTLAQHYGYVSDETIAFDDELRVLPYRKPLSVVRPGAPKDQVSPSDAGLRELPAADLALAAIVLLERDPSAAEPELEHLHFADAAPLLAAQSSYLREYEGTVCALAELCDRAGGVRLLRYAEATDVPAMIDALLVSDPAPAPWNRMRLDTIDAEGTASSADAVDFGDTVVAFSDSTMRVLEGIAPAVLHAAGESSDLDRIVNAALDVHGAPPSGDAAVMVRDVVAELVEVGLVSASVLVAADVN